MSNTTPQDPNFEALIQYLKRTRGFDFTGYKRPSLMRLMKKRIQRLGIENYSYYLDYLQVHPGELNELFNSLLLNVTNFFRDPEAWEVLNQEIIPQILNAKPNEEPIRVWSAGCASGEEAYTIAIVLAEVLGIEAFKNQVKIYATDLDEDALNQGRQAIYSPRILQNLSESLRTKYFEPSASNYIFRSDLRRCIIFGRHDLVNDAPISRLDLLLCRNTLMYFNTDTQSRILSRFHFALNNTGFLFVGKAEMLLTQTNFFTPANLKYRIFAKVPKINLRDRLLIMAESDHTEASRNLVGNIRLREEAFECLPVAQIVVDIQGDLVLANREARVLFNLSTSDIGRQLQDLEISYRPAELRSRIQQSYTERRSIIISEIELTRTTENTVVYLDIQVIPLLDNTTEPLGVIIVFQNVTRHNELQRELQRSTQELETAYEELQSTNEELETTNEELQSTNEELETTNEELQSTNEELETMNEELQSANEELQTTNDELRERTQELNRVTIFMESILTSLRVGMIVLDNRLSVQLWNGRAEELWGLRAEETVEHFFFDLDIGLPSEKLRGLIRACQTGNTEEQIIVVDAVNRRGKKILCRVICTTLIVEKEQKGVILLMDERLD
jgi:two-component system CheB/CheR fusion protein